MKEATVNFVHRLIVFAACKKMNVGPHKRQLMIIAVEGYVVTRKKGFKKFRQYLVVLIEHDIA